MKKQITRSMWAVLLSPIGINDWAIYSTRCTKKDAEEDAENLGSHVFWKTKLKKCKVAVNK